MRSFCFALLLTTYVWHVCQHGSRPAAARLASGAANWWSASGHSDRLTRKLSSQLALLNPLLDAAKERNNNNNDAKRFLRVNATRTVSRFSSTVLRRDGGAVRAKNKNSNVLLYSALHGLATTSRQLRGVGGGGGCCCSARLGCLKILPPPPPSSSLSARHRFGPIWHRPRVAVTACL